MTHGITRRSAVLAAPAILSAIGVSIGGRRATAATGWRMASKMPAESSEGKVYQRFADLVKEYSSGAVDVKVYPSEQLGKEEAVLEQLQLGTINIAVDSAFFMQKWVPEIKWLEPSFLFENREQWVRYTQTPLVQGWFDAVEKKVGVRALQPVTAVVRGPYRVICSTKPVNGLADLQGLKLRMYPDELATGVWAYLGTEPRIIAFTDTYQAIRTGVVQAVTSPVALVEDLKFQEVAPFVTRTNEFFQEIAFMVNARGLARLPDAQREAVLRAHKDAGAYSAQLADEVTKNSLQRMSAKGVTYKEIDTAPLVAKAREYYAKLDKDGKVPPGIFAAVDAAKAGKS